MKTRTLTFHTDPAHGWLEVTRADLIALDIENKISRYSYEKGSKVYLEEDCDQMTYLRAASAAGWDVKTKDARTDSESFIRFMNPYHSTAAARQYIAEFYDSNPNLTLADLSRFTGKPVKELKAFLMEKK
jgi:lipocalin